MKSFIRTYGAVVLSMVFWSFSFIWFKIANQEYSTLIIIYLRLFFSAVLLSLYLFLTGKFEKIKKSDRKLFFLMAFSEPFVYFMGESFGLTFVTPTVGAVIISTIPIFAALGGWLIYREKLKLINYAGIVISFAGVILFALNNDGSLSMDPRGLGLLFVAVVAAVGYTLLLKKLAGSYSPIFIVNVQNIIGLTLFAPVLLVFERDNIMAFSIHKDQFLAIIKLAIFASSGAFILFGYAVRSLGVTKANVFSNAIPVLTAILSFIILGEIITMQKAAGIVIVIIGLLLSQERKKKWTRPDGTILAGKTA